MCEDRELARNAASGAIFAGVGTPSLARFAAFSKILRLNSEPMTLSCAQVPVTSEGVMQFTRTP